MSFRIKLTRRIVILLVAALVATSVPMTVYAKDAIGSKLEIEKVEGTVYLVNKKGTKIEARTGVKLSSGESVQTSAGSYVYISLDESKLVKLNELSQVQVNKSGKKLSLKVEEGELYFEVNEKLAKDESMEFTASTMAMSVRGTAGIIGLRRVGDNIVSDVDLLDGRVDMIYSDIKGVNHEFTMWGGESASHIEGMPGLDRDLIDITEIAGFAAVEFANNPTLAAAILEQSGLNSQYAIDHSAELLAAGQAFYQSNYANVFIDGNTTSVASLHPMIADITVDQTRVDKQLKKDIKEVQSGKALETIAPTGEGIAPFATPEPTIAPVVLPTVIPTVKPTQAPVLNPNWNMPDEEETPVWDGGNSGGDNGGGNDGGTQGGGDSGGGSSEPANTPAPTQEPTSEPTQTPEPTPTPTPVKRYTVTFYGKDLDIISRQVVRRADSAEPPTVPNIDGYKFKKWDGSYTNIMQDTSVYAVYEPVADNVTIKYRMHINGDDAVYSDSDTRTYALGTSINDITDAPTVSDYEGSNGIRYTFDYWYWIDLGAGDTISQYTSAEAMYKEVTNIQYQVVINKRTNSTIIQIESFKADAGVGLKSAMTQIEDTLRADGYTSFIWGASGAGATSDYKNNLQGDIELEVVCSK